MNDNKLNNSLINPNKSLSKFFIFEAKANDKNIAENIDIETIPYPHTAEVAGPLFPSSVILGEKNNLIIIPTIENAIKLLSVYSLVDDINIFIKC